MFCGECGIEAVGKFCNQCGSPLVEIVESVPAESATIETVPIAVQFCESVPTTAWELSIDYLSIVKIPEIAEQIKFAENRAAKKLRGDQFIDLFDKAMKPFTGGISARLAAKISQPITSALGFKTGKSHQEFLAAPPGRVLARLAIALAEHGHKITEVIQQSNRCQLNAEIPADLCSIDGELEIVIATAAGGTNIAAAAIINGQWNDWGKCQRRLDELFRTVRKAA